MTPAHWERVKDLFGQACERAPEQRASFLAEACVGDEELRREVSSLLASHQDTGSVFDTPVGAAFAPRLDPLVGRSIGAYKIIRQIGRGGMGSVYLAERSDDQFRRRVAVKAVTAELIDEETLRRFHNERQTLATLDHPNIIKLLDGGTAADGSPYLVMDFVEGQAIDEYCNTHKLSINERLQLFRTVCSAVTYAHQNLVVHRDLKPSNILITPEGVPKLLDFGIAKLLKPEYSTSMAMTRTDLRPMTPEYASPEQIMGGPITTASDIYSLGVLLYRLLTGAHPYQLRTQSALELERAICQTEPERPSTSVLHGGEDGPAAVEGRRENLARLLKGDLDMIVLMAMRKEPQRRYCSAEHLAEDIRRHLEGRTVMACKDSLRYRVSKFVSRNTPAVAAAASIVAALIAATLISFHQAAVARKRFQDLRKFANFAINELDDGMRSGEITQARKKLVGRAVEYLDALAAEARNDASVQSDLIRGYLKMGDIQGNLFQANLGQATGAEQSYRNALKIADTLAPSDANSLVRASVNYKLADLLLTRNGKEALEKYADIRQIYDSLRAKDPANLEYLKSLVRAWDRTASTQQQVMGDEAGALQSYRRCLELTQEWLVMDPVPRVRELAAFYRQMSALFAARTGDTAGAADAIRESIRTYESSATPESSGLKWRSIAQAYMNLTEVQKITGKLPEALESAHKSLTITNRLLAKDATNSQYQIDAQQAAVVRIGLLIQSGKMQEARAETVRALQFLKPLAEQSDASVYQVQAYAWLLVTTPFADLRDNPAALTNARKAVAMTQEKDPGALDVLARAYARNSDFESALTVERQAIALLPPLNPSRGKPELRKMLEANLAGFRSGVQPGAEASQAHR